MQCCLLIDEWVFHGLMTQCENLRHASFSMTMNLTSHLLTCTCTPDTESPYMQIDIHLSLSLLKSLWYMPEILYCCYYQTDVSIYNTLFFAFLSSIFLKLYFSNSKIWMDQILYNHISKWEEIVSLSLFTAYLFFPCWRLICIGDVHMIQGPHMGCLQSAAEPHGLHLLFPSVPMW